MKCVIKSNALVKQFTYRARFRAHATISVSAISMKLPDDDRLFDALLALRAYLPEVAPVWNKNNISVEWRLPKRGERRGRVYWWCCKLPEMFSLTLFDASRRLRSSRTPRSRHKQIIKFIMRWYAPHTLHQCHFAAARLFQKRKTRFEERLHRIVLSRLNWLLHFCFIDDYRHSLQPLKGLPPHHEHHFRKALKI